MEDKKIVVEYSVDGKYLQDAYYAQYGVLDQEFIQKLEQSTAINMRNFVITFDNEKLALFNRDKNETNVFYYRDLYKIEQAENGFLFYIDKLNCYFVSYDFFVSQDLVIIKQHLQQYYAKNQETAIAVIKDYEFTSKKLHAAITAQDTIPQLLILLCFYSVILYYTLMWGNFIIIFWVLAMPICIVLFRRYMAIGAIKSMNKHYRCGKMSFYHDRLEFISKTKMYIMPLKYDEIYSIRKVRKGYLFNIQKYQFLFFFNDEFTPEQRQQLDVNFKQFKNYSS